MNRNLPFPRLLEILVLFLFSLPALSPLFTAVPTRSADGLLHLYRLVQLERLWREGVFFSRWLPDLAYGYGLPLFNYYAPLVYYLTTPLYALGISFPLALNLSLAAALFVSALGMFYFSRALLAALFSDAPQASKFVSAAALVAALAFLYAPYLLFNALHRGNLAEQWALAFAPFALWRFFVLTRTPNAIHWFLAALTFAAVMLSHNVTSFLFAPLLLFFTFACQIAQPLRFTFDTSRFNSLVSRFSFLVPLSAFLAALALSAFFWLPALAERDFVQIARVIVTPDFDYRFNFVPPLELVSLLPRADTGRMNPSFPSTLGIGQVLGAVIGVVILGVRWRSRRALPFFALAVAALGLVGMMLAVSRPLWDSIEILSFVQLPMRLRGLVALCLAPIIGISLFAVPARGRALGAGIAMGALVLSALPMLYPRYARDVPLNPRLSDMMAYEQQSGALGTTSFGEYLPVWVQTPPDASPFTEQYSQSALPDRFVIPEGVRICGGGVYPTTQVLCATADEPWHMIYRAFYFPGWRAFVNGKPVEITPTLRTGLVSFEVGEGASVVIRYQGTEIERTAEWLSIGAFVLCLGVLGFGVYREWRQPVSGNPLAVIRIQSLLPFAVLALVLFGVKALYTDRMSNPLVAHSNGSQVQGIGQAREVTFGGELKLLGYDVKGSNLSGAPAPVMQIKRSTTPDPILYWRALPALKRNLSTFVHLATPDGTVVAQKDNLHPGDLPTTRWESDAYVADEHPFEIPATLAPGDYELRAGVYDPLTNTRLQTSEGGDSILLSVIRVTE